MRVGAVHFDPGPPRPITAPDTTRRRRPDLQRSECGAVQRAEEQATLLRAVGIASAFDHRIGVAAYDPEEVWRSNVRALSGDGQSEEEQTEPSHGLRAYY